MIVRANNKDIQVKSILSEKIKRNGNSYPALRFEFENEITADDITALTSGSFEILNDNGEVMGTHEGYNTLKSVSVVVGKITTDEQRIEALEATLAQSEATNAELTTTLEATQAEKEELQSAINVMVGGSAE